MKKSEKWLLQDEKVLSDVQKLRFYPITAARGEGAVLWDADGKKYIDCTAGWGVLNTGCCHPRVVNAAVRQIKRLSFASTISVINEESIALGEKLTAMFPEEYESKVWYGHSGSDANEFIAKIAPVAAGRPKILTFTGSYHGQTMGSYAMSGHPSQNQGLGGNSGNVMKVPYPYCYRCPFQKQQQTCSLFCMSYLEDYLLKWTVDPYQIAAMVVEAVQCDGGDVVPPEGFLERLRKICDQYSIFLVLDEVKIGFGRTGKMFGYEHWNVLPDAVILGKPMGGGFPLSAVVGRRELMDAGTGMHLFTTAGNPLACASGLEALAVIQDESLMENAASLGEYLKQCFIRLKEKHSVIGDVRGLGMVLGIELVKGDDFSEPAPNLAAMAVYRAFELGLLCYYTGIFSNVLEFTPPLVLSRSQADEVVQILDRALEDTVSGRVSPEAVSRYAGWG